MRWIVTVLFGASIATYLYILAAQRRRSTNTVNHLLHLAMSAAMILMAWDLRMSLPTVGTMIFLLLAILWFVGVAGRMPTASGERVTNAYYAVMVAAMAWMFAVMNGSLPGRIGHPFDHAPLAAMAMNTSEPGMISAHRMSPTASGAQWITAVNWVATFGFAVVALLLGMLLHRQAPNKRGAAH